MPTLDQIDLVIREYHVINILLFIIGWMTYDLIKLSKSNKPSAEQLDMVKANIQKAKQLHEKQKFQYISNDRLKKDNHLLLKKIRSQSIFIENKEKEFGILVSENKFLKTKVDDLVEELMKRQSYDDVKKSKFFQESSYPVAKFTNHQGVNS